MKYQVCYFPNDYTESKETGCVEVEAIELAATINMLSKSDNKIVAVYSIDE